MTSIGDAKNRRVAHIAQAMLWVPAEVSLVRSTLHQAGLTPAVLVPVDSATAVVATAVTTVREAEQWAKTFEKAGGVAVTFAWGHDGNAYLVEVSGIHDGTLAARLAKALQVPEHTVEPFLRTDADNAAPLLDAAGKPGAALVARLVSAKVFDKWRNDRLSSATKSVRLIVACALAAFVLGIAVLALGLSPVYVAPFAMGFSLFVFWWLRRSVSRRPVDELLPIVPLSELGDAQTSG
jgi:hypothetical protein